METDDYTDADVIRRILKDSKTVAVVGASKNVSRASYGVARYMQAQGYRIIPVNPAYDNVLGEKCFESLLDIEEKIDVVDVFRRPDTVYPVVEEAVRIGAKAIWFQEGVINNEAADAAKEAGLDVVMDRCMLKEHRLISGGY